MMSVVSNSKSYQVSLKSANSLKSRSKGLTEWQHGDLISLFFPYGRNIGLEELRRNNCRNIVPNSANRTRYLDHSRGVHILIWWILMKVLQFRKSDRSVKLITHEFQHFIISQSVREENTNFSFKIFGCVCIMSQYKFQLSFNSYPANQNLSICRNILFSGRIYS
jgi:hypothetical protein